MEYKRPRLVAETADDLQNILFGEADEALIDIQGDSSNAIQVAAPIAEPEPEVFSDSDRGTLTIYESEYPHCRFYGRVHRQGYE